MSLVIPADTTCHRFPGLFCSLIRSQGRCHAPYTAKSISFLFPAYIYIIGEAIPAFLMIGYLVRLHIDSALFITQTTQVLSGYGITDLGITGTILRSDQRRCYCCRQILEDEPTDRFGCMNKCPQRYPVIPACLTKGIVQIKVYSGRRSQLFQREFQGSSRYLGRGRLLLIRPVVFLLDRKIVFFLHLLTHPGETVVRSGDTVHRTKIPEIGPVE